jgi:hypothetical protein
VVVLLLLLLGLLARRDESPLLAVVARVRTPGVSRAEGAARLCQEGDRRAGAAVGG